MPEIEYQIPPVTIHHRTNNFNETNGEHVGWQIRGWMVELIHSELGIRGENVTVGVGDTGISKSHAKEGGDLENTVSAKSFIGGESEWDQNGHGSHCQSNICAVDNGKGTLGYVPDAEGYHAKILSNEGSGGDRGIAEGISWLVDQGCHVISLSLGSPSKSRRIIKEIDDANREVGTIFVCASGNDGQSNGVDYPAASSECLIGCAIDSRHNLASFSDRGPQVSLRGVSGAGVRVYGCGARGYTLMSGTSMATPSVAGQLALAIDAEIELTGQQITYGYEDAIKLISKYRLDLGKIGNDSGFGIGAFDVYSYIKDLCSGSPPEKSNWKTIHSFDQYRLQQKEK
jgi:subtilisin family serine protease